MAPAGAASVRPGRTVDSFLHRYETGLRQERGDTCKSYWTGAVGARNRSVQLDLGNLLRYTRGEFTEYNTLD